MKLILSIISVFAFSVSAFSQSQTWGKSGKVIYPNPYPSTFRIDGGGTNSVTINNTNAAGTTITRFQWRGTNLFYVNGDSDGTTIATVDTSIPHTSGNLLEVKNNGTNKFYVDSTGLAVGPTYQIGGDESTPTFALYREGGDVLGTAFVPGYSDGDPANYRLNSFGTRSTGNLFEIQNNTTNQFAVGATGAITTSDPGGGAGAWKLGIKKTGVTVALVITNYVEVNIGGTVVKLAIVQ